MSAAIHVFELRRIWSRIHDALYSCKRDPHISKRNAEVKNIQSALDSWRQQIPMFDGTSHEVLSAWTSEEWFELAYSNSVLMLYRTAITTTRDGSHEAMLRSSEAAREVCNRYRRVYLGYPVSFTWGALHILFVAGLTYLHCLWSSEKVRQTHKLNEVRSVCAGCSAVMMIIAQRFVSASSYEHIFQELASKTIDMLQYQMTHDVGGGRLLENRNLPRETSDIGDNYDISGWFPVEGDVEMPDGAEYMISSMIHDLNDWEEASFHRIIEG